MHGHGRIDYPPVVSGNRTDRITGFGILDSFRAHGMGIVKVLKAKFRRSLETWVSEAEQLQVVLQNLRYVKTSVHHRHHVTANLLLLDRMRPQN